MLDLLVALAMSGSSFVPNRAPPVHAAATELRLVSAAEAGRRIRGKKFTNAVKTTTEIFQKDGSYISLSDLPVLVEKYLFVGNELCIEMRNGVRSCRHILVSRMAEFLASIRRAPLSK